MTTTIDATNDSNRHTLNFNGVNDVYLVLSTLMKSLHKDQIQFISGKEIPMRFGHFPFGSRSNNANFIITWI